MIFVFSFFRFFSLKLYIHIQRSKRSFLEPRARNLFSLRYDRYEQESTQGNVMARMGGNNEQGKKWVGKLIDNKDVTSEKRRIASANHVQNYTENNQRTIGRWILPEYDGIIKLQSRAFIEIASVVLVYFIFYDVYASPSWKQIEGREEETEGLYCQVDGEGKSWNFLRSVLLKVNSTRCINRIFASST